MTKRNKRLKYKKKNKENAVLEKKEENSEEPKHYFLEIKDSGIANTTNYGGK